MRTRSPMAGAFVLSVLLTGAAAFVGGATSQTASDIDHRHGTRHPVPAAQTPPSETPGPYGKSPIVFTENRGQWDQRVLFRACDNGATIWFCRDGIYYWFFHRTGGDKREALSFRTGPAATAQVSTREHLDGIQRAVVHAAFVDANQQCTTVGYSPLPYRSHFFLGQNECGRYVDAPNYEAVVYRDICPGVDLRYEGSDGVLTSKWETTSGADVSSVRLHYSGSARIATGSSGELRIEAPWGTIHRPALLPPPASAPAPLSAATPVDHGNQAAAITASLTSNAGVQIAYSSYLGGGTSDRAYGVATDTAGCTVIVGVTYSADFDTTCALGGNIPGADIFITKMAPVGGALLYSTYLGGNDYDRACAVAVDADGSTYITGYTWSSNFPTAGAIQGDAWYVDGFVTKLSAEGDSLIYSSYLGGSGSDAGHAIAVDATGSAYITGSTSSADFPAVNPYQGRRGAMDAFVARLNSSGNALLYSTYLGGSGDEDSFGLAVDTAGHAYVTGYTFSTDFPTANALQTNQGAGDAFVTELNVAGDSALFSTYLGGNDDDEGRGIALDRAGNACVVGNTFSSDFPVAQPYQSNRGTADVFVTKLGSSGGVPLYSTYLGGSKVDMAYAIAVNAVGCVYVTGYTSSVDFPTHGPVQGDQAGEDAFAAKLQPDGQSLAFSTYIGGSGADYGQCIALGPDNSVYVVGHTSSPDFPVVNAYEGDQAYEDATVTRLVEPSCACDCLGNPICDNVVTDVFDVTAAVNVAFRGISSLTDPNSACPFSDTDVDCVPPTTIVDVLRIMDVAFRSADPATEFCDPCAP